MNHPLDEIGHCGAGGRGRPRHAGRATDAPDHPGTVDRDGTQPPVGDLGRKLLYKTGRRILPGSGPDWTDDPAGFVAELESIPEGARWLRDRWAEILALILAANENKVSAEEMNRLRQQVLRNLIDETLQIQEAKAAGMDAYVTKPLTPALFYKTLAAELAKTMHLS